jgi:hypothetical protein
MGGGLAAQVSGMYQNNLTSVVLLDPVDFAEGSSIETRNGLRR